MSDLLYEICSVCEGSGVIRLHTGNESPCHCKPLCVVESGLTVRQVQAVIDELQRCRLRMSALDKREQERDAQKKGG